MDGKNQGDPATLSGFWNLLNRLVSFSPEGWKASVFGIFLFGAVVFNLDAGKPREEPGGDLGLLSLHASDSECMPFVLIVTKFFAGYFPEPLERGIHKRLSDSFLQIIEEYHYWENDSSSRLDVLVENWNKERYRVNKYYMSRSCIERSESDEYFIIPGAPLKSLIRISLLDENPEAKATTSGFEENTDSRNENLTPGDGELDENFAPHPIFFVSLVNIAIVTLYSFVIIIWNRGQHWDDKEKWANSIYYMGFIITLFALVVALGNSVNTGKEVGAVGVVIQNAIALSSTAIGLTLRTLWMLTKPRHVEESDEDLVILKASQVSLEEIQKSVGASMIFTAHLLATTMKLTEVVKVAKEQPPPGTEELSALKTSLEQTSEVIREEQAERARLKELFEAEDSVSKQAVKAEEAAALLLAHVRALCQLSSACRKNSFFRTIGGRRS